ncbi:MAG: methionyl-tRNA formyltransferase, partial [Spirochaetaceae bacterium]|nr:methionyl-tRNA formyltransferase [Spirochaetaceae bacterium]
LFPLGGINVHPSLLPKYRGAAPIPAAILNRDSETGITIQRIAAELDSGNVLFQETVPLSGRETAASLGADMAEKGAALLVRALCAIAEGAVSETPQDDSVATFCGKIKRQDGLIDWRLDAASIDARIRAFTPWPLSYTRHGNAELYILEAAPYYGPVGADTASGAAGAVIGTDRNAGIVIKTGNGLLAARHLQYSARKALDWRSFLNGARNFIGSTLG